MTLESRRPSELGQSLLPPGVHLVIDGADRGPIDAASFGSLAAEGRIGAATLAWHPGLDDWTEIGRLPELAGLIGPAASLEVRPAVPVIAGLVPRLAAGTVDLVAWLGLVALLSVPLGLTSALTGASDDPALAHRFDLLAQGTAAIYYLVLMSGLGGGASLGYRLLGLRLVKEPDFAPPSLLRTIVWYIVTYVRIVGWLTYFFDSKRRMLHNIVSQTLVIVARGPGQGSRQGSRP